jgi:hypothetical protein
MAKKQNRVGKRKIRELVMSNVKATLPTPQKAQSMANELVNKPM